MTHFPNARKAALRAGGALLLAGVLTGTGLGVAEAHVRVFADQSASGSFSALTFRVPNESDTAGTTEVSVQLPQDTPFLYVSNKPVPGWKVTTTQETLPKPVESEGTTITKAVRTVTWTAERGREIAPGEYQEFSLSVGPLPAPGTVLLPATQTYADKTVVRWNEPTPAGGEEPEHPAPELTVTAGNSGDGHGHDAPPPVTAAAAAASGGTDNVARGLGIAGLVVGLAGLAAAALNRRTRSAPPA